MKGNLLARRRVNLGVSKQRANTEIIFCGNSVMICHVCNYGYVHKYKVLPLDRILLICTECDAVWFDETQVKNKEVNYHSENIVLRLDLYLNQFGLTQKPEYFQNYGKLETIIDEQGVEGSDVIQEVDIKPINSHPTKSNWPITKFEQKSEIEAITTHPRQQKMNSSPFNTHLLRHDFTVEEYEKIVPSIKYNPEWHRLPAYTIARCPFCLAKNIEKLDTYSLQIWRIFSVDSLVSGAMFYHNLVVYHCPHFVLTQTFFSYHNNPLPDKFERSTIVTMTSPYVIGHLLESGRCLAVMHALPICRIEGASFIPSYSVVPIVYFSKQPEEALRDIHKYNDNWYSIEASSTLFLSLQFGKPHWADLSHWVTAGQLFWVDGNDAELNIHTNDAGAFPYGEIANLSVRTERKFCIQNNSKADLLLYSDLRTETIKVENNNTYTFDLLGNLSNVRPKLTVSTQGLIVSFLEQPERTTMSNDIMEMLEIENVGHTEVSFELQSWSWSLRLRKGDVVQFWDSASLLKKSDEEYVTWGYVPRTIHGTRIEKGNYISISPVTGKYKVLLNGKEITNTG